VRIDAGWPDFLEGELRQGGEAGALILGLTWGEHPNGPPSKWPRELQTAVGMMIASLFPLAVAWGEEFSFVYNGPFRPILGATRHPSAMGAPMRSLSN
jgi:hypothetical protein